MTSYLWNGAAKAKGYPGWNLLKSSATSDGIHSGAICMLLFPLGYFKMKYTEEMDNHR
jgi:hypothetical protein